MAVSQPRLTQIKIHHMYRVQGCSQIPVFVELVTNNKDLIPVAIRQMKESGSHEAYSEVNLVLRQQRTLFIPASP